MRWLIIAMLAASCEHAEPPKTPESMLAYRQHHGLAVCGMECPIGEVIDTPTKADCCVDPNGTTWSTCAWNGAGRFATREQLASAPLHGCGGEGYPDCTR